MKSKLGIFSCLLILGILVNCQSDKSVEKAAWTPVLDQNDVFVLNRPLTQVNKHLSAVH